jgi:hypothetical protein
MKKFPLKIPVSAISTVWLAPAVVFSGRGVLRVPA